MTSPEPQTPLSSKRGTGGGAHGEGGGGLGGLCRGSQSSWELDQG